MSRLRPAALSRPLHPDLANVWYPKEIGDAFFTQTA